MDNNKREILKKVYLVYFVMVAVGLAIIGKAAYIQLIEGEEWREKAKKVTIRYDKIEANRGNILASDGSLLAASVPVFELRIDAGNTHFDDEFYYHTVDSLAWHLSNHFKDRTKQEEQQQVSVAEKKCDLRRPEKSKEVPGFPPGKIQGRTDCRSQKQT